MGYREPSGILGVREIGIDQGRRKIHSTVATMRISLAKHMMGAEFGLAVVSRHCAGSVPCTISTRLTGRRRGTTGWRNSSGLQPRRSARASESPWRSTRECLRVA